MRERAGNTALRLAALLLPGLLAAEEAPRPVPVIGSTAEYSGRLMGSDCPRWTLQLPGTDDTLVRTCEGNTLEISRTHDDNPMRLRDASGRTLVEFRPFMPSLAFPLAIDKRWSGKYTGFTAFNNLVWEGETHCKVAALEKVHVQAGEFDAWRVECADGWQVGRHTGSAQTTRWYAPAAGLVVKEVHERDPAQWNFELKSRELAAVTPAALEAAPTPPVTPPTPAVPTQPAPAPATPSAPDRPGILDPNEY